MPGTPGRRASAGPRTQPRLEALPGGLRTPIAPVFPQGSGWLQTPESDSPGKTGAPRFRTDLQSDLSSTARLQRSRHRRVRTSPEAVAEGTRRTPHRSPGAGSEDGSLARRCRSRRLALHLQAALLLPSAGSPLLPSPAFPTQEQQNKLTPRYTHSTSTKGTFIDLRGLGSSSKRMI